MKREDLSVIMREAHMFRWIAGIGLSDALKQSWRNFKLKLKMAKGIAKFYFLKIDGTIREAYGTLNSRNLPATEMEKRRKNDTIQVYFDTEKQSWRCYKKLNLIRIAI